MIMAIRDATWAWLHSSMYGIENEEINRRDGLRLGGVVVWFFPSPDHSVVRYPGLATASWDGAEDLSSPGQGETVVWMDGWIRLAGPGQWVGGRWGSEVHTLKGHGEGRSQQQAGKRSLGDKFHRDVTGQSSFLTRPRQVCTRPLSVSKMEAGQT